MFEHVIRIPFDMRPVFKPCERPSYNANNTDVHVQHSPENVLSLLENGADWSLKNLLKELSLSIPITEL